MKKIKIKDKRNSGITDSSIIDALKGSLEQNPCKKVLLIPPDLTRSHSYAGKITAMYYELLKDSAQVNVLPALGTHDPMDREECEAMFGKGVPFDSIIAHNWRTDVESIGVVPGSYVKEVSGGLLDYDIDVRINREIIHGGYDLILSIGQVVPHEVVGMANYSKNVLVGCAGKDVIDKTHMLGAVCGMEEAMGKDGSPVRKVLDYAQEKFLDKFPVVYVLTVTVTDMEGTRPEGIFIGKDRTVFEEAVEMSAQRNIQLLDEPIKKCVVYLDPKEFRSTWLGNKSIYRTRMAIADDGELIILAPGVRKFGEDEGIDSLIRKYGYIGSEKINELARKNEDLKSNLSAAAHLIHGSSEGRFEITYAVEHLTKEEVEKVNFKYMPLKEAIKKYDPKKLEDGYNIMDTGEKIFYISNPALGLWASKDKFRREND